MNSYFLRIRKIKMKQEQNYCAKGGNRILAWTLSSYAITTRRHINLNISFLRFVKFVQLYMLDNFSKNIFFTCEQHQHFLSNEQNILNRVTILNWFGDALKTFKSVSCCWWWWSNKLHFVGTKIPFQLIVAHELNIWATWLKYTPWKKLSFFATGTQPPKRIWRPDF